jgi:hypothetical protein
MPEALGSSPRTARKKKKRQERNLNYKLFFQKRILAVKPSWVSL